MPHLTHSIKDSIAVITLQNPPQNRLTSQLVRELEAALTAISESDARALVVRADGPDFSFGGDIVEWPGMSQRELRTLFEQFMNCFNHFERLSIPTIAAVQGLCFGGGLELAVRADLVFAAETARFGHPEQSLGIVTVVGGVYRIAERVGRTKAMEWALTSEQVPAAVMERYGVVNRVVPDARLFDETMAFASRLAVGPTRAHAAHKALLRLWATGGVTAADEAMFDIALPLFESKDVQLALPASVEAFLAKQPRPLFPFTGE
ncbi:enoyl-CoA hydratase/isomerase family protein [Paraburkholderia youngii]|uniref:Enoyl-CoA hydratase/carnithine racemase n=1 Tax=Paraburkholderia youngii TaxID=2782701 RepID=A0A7W8P6Q2_9BURK|nr:enoyl-CoA hydratase/isomerase family protein [Paraburkholderia youngii]MBB5404460.1 enoyl-CoA hydratase/carnithine racemase [Paraburkholderia youngii]